MVDKVLVVQYWLFSFSGPANISIDVCPNFSEIEDGSSCTVFIENAELSWLDAFEDCMAKAPAGFRGRLAHITTTAMVNMSIFSSSGWLGARTDISESSDAADFFWLENKTYLAEKLSYLPTVFEFGKFF